MIHFDSILNNTYSLCLLIVFGVAALALALYYGLFYLRVGRWKNPKTPSPDAIDDQNLPSVSVVMVAHNEGAYLKENLVYLLEQNYPRFEVIVVDYLSTDETKFALQVCGDSDPNLKAIPFKEDVNFFTGKKYPLSIGIRSATNDVILLTEPDCVPKGFDWIRTMVSGYMHNADMVLGFCGVRQEKGLLNAFLQYDNLTTSAHAFGCAIMGNPYTGNGRNLSYKRQFFFDRGAFTSHYRQPEGADDIFVNQNANRKNTEVVLDDKAFMLSEPRSSFAAWRLMRKARYASKHYYGLDDLASLAVHPVALLFFYLAGILFALRGLLPLIIFGAAMLLLWTWHIVTFSRVCKRFGVKWVFWFAPLMEMYFFFANTIMMTFALLKKK